MEITAIALSGMTAARDRFEHAAARIASPQQDSVELSTEAVALIEAQNAFTANARVAHAGDEMEQHVLDILG